MKFRKPPSTLRGRGKLAFRINEEAGTAFLFREAPESNDDVDDDKTNEKYKKAKKKFIKKIVSPCL